MVELNFIVRVLAFERLNIYDQEIVQIFKFNSKINFDMERNKRFFLDDIF